MGKIKSAAELAMEKTTKLTDENDYSRSEIKFSEYVKAGSILAKALIEGKTDLEKSEEAFSKYPPEAKKIVINEMFKIFAEGISLKNTDVILKFVRFVEPGNKALIQACDDVSILQQKFQDKLTNEESISSHKTKEMQMDILNKEKIKGSAIHRVNLKNIDEEHGSPTSQTEEEYLTQIWGFRSFLSSCRGSENL